MPPTAPEGGDDVAGVGERILEEGGFMFERMYLLCMFTNNFVNCTHRTGKLLCERLHPLGGIVTKPGSDDGRNERN
ncbi:hypothetical protein EVAR_36321_1 [Eumeta japonica]|uniref:Uncharacterized protein n=1 Tax=Eumeta variegata TaxID=151549 RepID=A0A4C1VGY3_EUMVA|nr:hypothetical protein EVAR_36321_1 [Eumeta japonica]